MNVSVNIHTLFFLVSTRCSFYFNFWTSKHEIFNFVIYFIPIIFFVF